MTDDTEVLSRLRVQATEEAPPLTLQAEDVIRAGRRRQTLRRGLGAGAGVVVVAASAAFAITFNGVDESSAPEPTDRTVQPTFEFDAHAMPALLKEAVLSPMDELPRWTSFRIDPTDGLRVLPQSRWGEADSWTLGGIAKDGAISMEVSADDQSARGVSPETYCAAPLDGIPSTCEHVTRADGSILVQYWAPTHDPNEPDAMNAGRWSERVVKVYHPDTGFSVEIREAASGVSPDAVARRLWLSPEELVDMATSTMALFQGPR